MELLCCREYKNDTNIKIFVMSIEKRLTIPFSSYNNKTNKWVVFMPSYDKNPHFDLSGNRISFTDERYKLLEILNVFHKPENRTYQSEEGYYKLFDKLAEEKNLKSLRIYMDNITDISVIFDKIEYYYIHSVFLNEYTLLVKDEHLEEVKILLSLIGVYNEN